MIELRIKFMRNEEVKYISHLDVMKLFERAIRRANIKISYSHGFNPHPKIIFGLPLAVGVSSMEEYADIGVEDGVTPAEFMNMINGALPKGYSVVDAKIKTSKGNIMAQVEAATYEVVFWCDREYSMQILDEKIIDFMKQDVVMFLKDSKGAKKNADVRPLFLEMSMINMEDLLGFDPKRIYHKIKMKLSVGQRGNLKPQDAIMAFGEFANVSLKISCVNRVEMFALSDGLLVNPLDDNIILQSG